MSKTKSKKKQSQRLGTPKINIKDDEAVAQRKAVIKSRDARISHAHWWNQSKVEKEIAQEAIKGLKFKEVAHQKPGKRDEEYYKKQAEWEKHLASLKPNDRIPYGGNSRRYEYLEGTYKTKGELSDLKKDREAQLQEHLKNTPKMERWIKKAQKDVAKLQKQLTEAKTEKTKRKIERKLSARRKRMDELQKKKLSFDDAQRFNSYRSEQARKQDEKKQANVVEDWRWVQSPDRYDFEGVDTPHRKYNKYIEDDLQKKAEKLRKKEEARALAYKERRSKVLKQLSKIEATHNRFSPTYIPEIQKNKIEKRNQKEQQLKEKLAKMWHYYERTSQKGNQHRFDAQWDLIAEKKKK